LRIEPAGQSGGVVAVHCEAATADSRDCANRPDRSDTSHSQDGLDQVLASGGCVFGAGRRAGGDAVFEVDSAQPM
jgi:hypothetical protein